MTEALLGLGNDLEYCACPVCNEPESKASPYGSGPYQVVTCKSCGLWYLSPRAIESRLRDIYLRDEYFEGDGSGYDDYAGQQRSLRATFRAVLKQLAKRGATGGALLEVGCGYGYFLDEARPFFDRRVGTDMSPSAARVAAGNADTVYQGDLSAVPQDCLFDCIVALHVVEHVYHPPAFIRQLSAMLKPGGALLLAAPDMGGFWRKVMGDKWPSFKYPEHVVFYDRRTLSSVMRDAGLSALDTVPYPHAFSLRDIFTKLGFPAFDPLQRVNVWLPSTTVAVLGRAPGAVE